MDHVALALATVSLVVTRYIFPGRIGYAILCLLFMVGLPLALIRYRKERLGGYLIGLGDLKGGLGVSLLLIALSFPFMYYATTMASFQDYYPLWKPAGDSVGNFLLFESYVLVLMFCTEFFYRGFLLNTLLKESRHGNGIHALVYMIAHLGKPPLEVLYSLPAGWIFAKVDMKYKSILPSLLMHYVSSVIFDLLVIYHA
ncbi:MAG: CPBP family intramembrane metalloprotease [Candidatus Altiarchaeales archaeon]|nr:CPBP family intramembrane metalloprotease [Candidatus Altiarchaeales archaeon]MBD3416329.1 CPBP family intramembrane metalloprotease [Candidatus Altiarchaeales archaeon]